VIPTLQKVVLEKTMKQVVALVVTVDLEAARVDLVQTVTTGVVLEVEVLVEALEVVVVLEEVPDRQVVQVK